MFSEWDICIDLICGIDFLFLVFINSFCSFEIGKWKEGFSFFE